MPALWIARQRGRELQGEGFYRYAEPPCHPNTRTIAVAAWRQNRFLTGMIPSSL
jgi:hypothetical protein